MAYNERSYQASVKYKSEKIKRVPLDLQKEQFESIKAHAAERGETVNGFIKRAVMEAMERDAGIMPNAETEVLP